MNETLDEMGVASFTNQRTSIRRTLSDLGMVHVRFPLSLPNVEDLLAERGIYISHETVRFWWDRFGSKFASDIGRASAECAGFGIRVGISRCT